MGGTKPGDGANDGQRDIGVRKHAVLRTAIPGHDKVGTSPAMTAESAHSSPLMIRMSRTAPSPSARSASW